MEGDKVHRNPYAIFLQFFSECVARNLKVFLAKPQRVEMAGIPASGRGD